VVDGFVVNCLTHELKAAEVTAVLEEHEKLSKAALSDHGRDKSFISMSRN
jgi:hypothetical protein